MATHHQPQPHDDLAEFYRREAERYQREALEARTRADRLQAENAAILDRVVTIDQEVGKWRDGFASMAELMTSLRLTLGDLVAARQGRLGPERTERAYQRAEELLAPGVALEEIERSRAIVEAASRLPIAMINTIMQRAANGEPLSVAVCDFVAGRVADLNRALECLPASSDRDDHQELCRIALAAGALPFEDLVVALRQSEDHDAERALRRLGLELGIYRSRDGHDE